MKNYKGAFYSTLLTLVIISTTFAFVLLHEPKETNLITSDDIGEESKVNEFNLMNVNEVQSTQEDRIPINNQIFNSRKNIITETVAEVSSAVVGVNVTAIRTYRDPWSADPFFRRFFGDRIYKQEVQSLGSGAIISPDGYIISNDHVAGNAEKVIVTMTDGTRHEAEVVGSDKISDICLLKIDGSNLPYIKLGDSETVMIGEWAIALGNPFGLFQINDKPTVTVGVVSAMDMNLGETEGRFYLDMIQTDAAINSGNSGGPLLNSLGEMIGMNTIIYTAGGSSGSVGVGFAIPINKVKRIVADLKEFGVYDRNFWTGLKIQTLDEGLAKYYNLDNTKGVIITEIYDDSPAETSGLKVGDIITWVNKFRINDYNSLISVLYEFKTGDNIKIKVIRDKKEITINMLLEKRND
ncbi:MAG: trypsin-like peptidase domain-containing protein [Melioribacteraceae bacterium]|nr:trypsin-like peptidase domain-containing protein [Melioribacteraceae bacterium]MCF8413919.1 trypsin-like peptidase domain-containing protein [Melioribacteraceae bacterium]MCF8431142.1 trypsin-like peptidase domain-containing protein [Melioribacteraceae bacterium]